VQVDERRLDYRPALYEGCIFGMLPLERFRVEFQRGEGDGIEAIILHRPNGTFRARRVDRE
jgi:hypothetical protein